ncbi:MAG: hypothetical protein HQL52_18080 [Magnetococcales bacterium]|nr:hypothetical protein [Magnetococcales bacterium]
MKVVVENYANNRWSWFKAETDDPDALHRQLLEAHPEWTTIRISPESEWFKRINHPIGEVMPNRYQPTSHLNVVDPALLKTEANHECRESFDAKVA